MCMCVFVCLHSQSGELAHIGEGVIGQGADFIVAQISAETKVNSNQYILTLYTAGVPLDTVHNNIHIARFIQLSKSKI